MDLDGEVRMILSHAIMGHVDKVEFETAVEEICKFVVAQSSPRPVQGQGFEEWWARYSLRDGAIKMVARSAWNAALQAPTEGGE